MNTKQLTRKYAARRLKRSMTVWFNAAVAVVASLLAVAETQFALLKPYLGEKTWGLALFIVVMVNAALRLRTEIKHLREMLD